MILLAKVALIAVGTAVAGGALISSEGFVHVSVHEKGPGGHNISIVVPATLATTSMHFVPKRHLREACDNMKEWGPTVTAAIDQLEKMDDFTLVEVTAKDQHVKVSKEHGSIIVDVNDPENTVYVSTPLRAIEATLKEIEVSETETPKAESRESKDSKNSAEEPD
jgi:hypothetical protein